MSILNKKELHRSQVTLLEKVERITEVPLMILSLIMIPLLLGPFLWYPLGQPFLHLGELGVVCPVGPLVGIPLVVVEFLGAILKAQVAVALGAQ